MQQKMFDGPALHKFGLDMAQHVALAGKGHHIDGA
jgi:hypothetical protein